MQERIIEIIAMCSELLDLQDPAINQQTNKVVGILEEMYNYLEQAEAGSEDIAISMNVSGTPDLHIRNPKQFAKMKKYYDPERQPFTTYNWFTTMWLKKDTRPYKKVDGFQKTNPKTGPDWYWITKGVSDVTAKWWNAAEIKYGLTEEQELANVRKYRGGFRQKLDTWPDHYKAALPK